MILPQKVSVLCYTYVPHSNVNGMYVPMRTTCKKGFFIENLIYLNWRRAAQWSKPYGESYLGKEVTEAQTTFHFHAAAEALLLSEFTIKEMSKSGSSEEGKKLFLFFIVLLSM